MGLQLWLNRLELKERTTCIKFRNKNKLNFKKEKWRRTESRQLLTTPKRLEVRSQPTRILKSKIDWTTWKREEKSERKSIWRETRSRTFKLQKYRSFRMLV